MINQVGELRAHTEEVNWRCYYLLFKMSFFIGRTEGYNDYSSGALGNTLLIQTLPNIQQIHRSERTDQWG